MTGHTTTDNGGVSAHCVQRDPSDGGDADTAAACLLAEATAFARMAAQGPTRAYAAHLLHAWALGAIRSLPLLQER
ncbi:MULTISPECIES: hypothetical protein [unclassified Streptomyces]|uniref:hypothetical protein n=1 Tax=unclassified Streptomyces TaxID=2593676 RepID=UPI00236620BA|nr:MULTISPECIES: hypothetical protein [unclassified Streptomyces]MDF3139790.1 hypothetical protein [Streptomyces sp. T21Q-yed]WDF42480.1 hypothetical protein PBV52_39635 [Streptomyces sp. T12]